MKYSLFIGRFQPLHAGHVALIRKVLNEGRPVLVALRDTIRSDANPYSLGERTAQFYREFLPELQHGQLRLMTIPDIEEVCHGRKVGWGIREIRLDEATEAISATAIRAEQ